MKFIEINMAAFAAFTNKLYSFDKNIPFHFIFGPNESGKSTTLRAITQMLFGIKNNTNDDFIHSKSDLSIGATIESADGKLLTFKRKKSNKNSLIDINGNTIQEDQLRSFFNYLNEDQFSKLFGLNHDYLVSGGENILKSGGDADITIFEAVSGLSGLYNLIQSLENDANLLYTNTKNSRKPINSDISIHKDINKEIGKLLISESECKQNELSLTKLLNQKRELTESLYQCQSNKDRLAKISNNIPNIELYHHNQKKLIDYINTPELDDNSGEKRIQATINLSNIEVNIKRYMEEQHNILSKITSINVLQEFIDNKNEIVELYKYIMLYRDQCGNLPSLNAQLEEMKLDINNMLFKLDINNEVMDEITSLNEIEIRHLAEKIRSIDENIRNNNSDIEEINSTIESIISIIGSDYRTKDLTALEAAIESITKLGDLESEYFELHSQYTSDKSSIEKSILVKLNKQLSIDAIEKQYIIDDCVIETYEKYYNEFESKLNDIDAQKKQLNEMLIDKNTELNSYDINVVSYTYDDLTNNRKARDTLWNDVKTNYIYLQEDLKNDAYINNLHNDLDENFKETDVITECLLAQSDNTAKYKTISNSIGELSTKLEALDESLKNLNISHSTTKKAWTGYCSNMHLPYMHPKQLRIWISELKNIHKDIARLNNSLKDLTVYKDKIQYGKECLIDALNEVGALECKINNLVALLNYATSILKKLSNYNLKYDEYTKCTREKNLINEKNKELSLNKEALLLEWNQITYIYKFGKVFDSEIIDEKLHQIKTLIDNMKSYNQLMKDKRECNSKISAYEKRANQLLVALGISYDGNNIAQFITELHANLVSNEQAVITKNQLSTSLANLKETIDQQQADKEENLNILRQLCMDAGLHYENIHELPKLEKMYNEKKIIKDEIERISTLLIQQNAKSLDDIISEAISYNAEKIESEIAFIEGHISETEKELSSINQQIGAVKEKINQLDNREAASIKAQELESVAARIGKNIDRYAYNKFAIYLLSKIIQIHSERNETPVLQKAKCIYKSITLGQYVDLKIIFDDKLKKNILVGVRHNGDEVTAECMSKGTRDQLYLSLRLAAIEMQIENRGPIPIILDDILIQFDKERVIATLEILRELSSKTQIIFFSHNEEVLALAKQVLNEKSMQVHYLNRCYSLH